MLTKHQGSNNQLRCRLRLISVGRSFDSPSSRLFLFLVVVSIEASALVLVTDARAFTILLDS